MQRTISFERGVRVDFDAAAAALAAQAPDVVLDDPLEGTLALDAKVAGFLVSRPVSPTIRGLEGLDPHAVVLPLAWEAAEHPRRFPTFEGMLELSSMSVHPPQSQLALVGQVTPPLGMLGTIGEAAGGTQIADGVLQALLDRIADRLVAVVAERQARAAAATTPTHLSRPRLVMDS